MTSAFESAISEAMAELEKQRDELMRQQQTLDEITATVRSKRRQVTATVDARGDLIELKLHGQAYKNMAPDDLAKLIMETIQEAKQDAKSQMWESLADTLPEGVEVAEVASGRHDWSETLGDALKLPKTLTDLLQHPPPNLFEGTEFKDLFDALTTESDPSGRAEDVAGGFPPQRRHE